jgi:ABC-type uncharacterized transport system auxiliary subunit
MKVFEQHRGQTEEVPMQRKVYPILISLLALALAGCGSSKPIRYYTIHPPLAPGIAKNTFPVSLLVGSINGPQFLQDSPIAYRVGSHEIGTYQYSRWVDPPVVMVKDKLIHTLSSSGDYRSVVSLGSKSDGQYVVRGRLYEFEEVDSDGISGIVSMEFELYDRMSGKVMWSHSYSQAEPVQEKEMTAVVAALETNLDRGLKEVSAGLGQYFSASSNLATKP